MRYVRDRRLTEAAKAFLPHLGQIPSQLAGTAYGVCCNSDDAGNFDYVCGVEVKDFYRLPANWSRVRIAGQRYAIFSQREHISTIRSMWNAIWNNWLPESGYELVDAPNFERYFRLSHRNGRF
jgi:AraC family transcriptional regulator